MKNTERLLSRVLADIENSVVAKYELDVMLTDLQIEEIINSMSNNELLKVWLEWNGIIGYPIKELVESIFGVELKSGKPKEWCCWTLSEKEITKAIDGVGVSVHNDEKDDFIEEIADNFRDCLSVAAEEWEFMLKQCVKDVSETWNR